MTVAFFDLDHTLLDGDSDQLWGDFLREQGEVDGDFQQQKNAFFAAYQHGDLDIVAFQRFMLATVKGQRLHDLQARLQQFAQNKIAAVLRPQGLAQWRWHQEQQHRTVIITATNRVIASASLLLIEQAELIATEPEIINDRISGEISGTPSFREGKIIRAQQYCAQHSETLEHCYFYSDSHNDLPLLNCVRYPHAVRPDQRLRDHAVQRNWPILLW